MSCKASVLEQTLGEQVGEEATVFPPSGLGQVQSLFFQLPVRAYPPACLATSGHTHATARRICTRAGVRRRRSVLVLNVLVCLLVFFWLLYRRDQNVVARNHSAARLAARAQSRHRKRYNTKP